MLGREAGGGISIFAASNHRGKKGQTRGKFSAWRGGLRRTKGGLVRRKGGEAGACEREKAFGGSRSTGAEG